MVRKLTQICGVALVLGACGTETADNTSVRGLPVIELEPSPLTLSQPPQTNNQTKLKNYQSIAGLSGNISSAGSDTLANLMTLWSDAFKREYPSVNIQVQAAGSSTAPPALTEGTANLGPMSRAFKDNELEAFQQRYGYKPTAIRVAIDAVAVYVHKDNPLTAMSIEQIDATFSVTRRCGGRQDIRFWGDLGLTGGWRERPIQIYGRNSVSGTYGYFKSVALCGGDYKNSLNEQPGSASVVRAVASSLNGIGYSGIGYKTSGIKSIPIARRGNFPIAATTQTATDGSYPLSRYFYIYVNKPPNQPLLPVEQEFIRLVLSSQGQAIVEKDGYIPVSAQIAYRELQKLN
ncbi:MAG: PstS family phosphate ABC transporter substrate-binding protein [bacterium]